MKTPIILSALSTLAILLLPSCVDPNYYGTYRGSSHYGSSSYSTLPYGYSRVHVGGMPYYYYGSRWYRRSSGRYISCARPHGYHGSIGRSHHYSNQGISRLPHGYRSVNVGSSRYYNHGNNWYRKSGNRYVTCPQPHGYSRGHSNHYKHKEPYHKPSNYRGHSGRTYKPGTYHKPSSHNKSSGKTYVKSHADRGHSSHNSAQHKSKPSKKSAAPSELHKYLKYHRKVR